MASSQFRGPNYVGARNRPLHRQPINVIELKSDIGENASASEANLTFSHHSRYVFSPRLSLVMCEQSFLLTAMQATRLYRGQTFPSNRLYA